MSSLFGHAMAVHYDDLVTVSCRRPGQVNLSIELTVLTWNLGYSGLGAEAEFVADGGKRLRVANRDLPGRWKAMISQFLASRTEDALLLQEVARPSWANHRTDLFSDLCGHFPGRPHRYAHEVRLPLPFGCGNEIGCVTFSSHRLGGRFETKRLPGHGRDYVRQYPALLLRFDHAGAAITLVNAHLSAFDDGARLRARQLAALLAIGAAECAAGRHVVIGADFNYELAPPPRPHTTDMKHMAWLHSFPPRALPDGWRIACDPAVPTFRSADKPYRAGENYCGVIDGFIVSPGLEVVKVAGFDLDFAASDHNPVALTVRAAGVDGKGA